MSQSDFGNLSSPLSGTTLINEKLEPWRDALHSTHAGNSRPAYVQPGMLWINNTTNPWILNIWDGSQDIVIGSIDTVANTFGVGGISAYMLTLLDDTSATAARSTLGLGSLATLNALAAGSVTNAMLANMTANSVKARVGGSSGVPSDVALSASQLFGRGSSGDIAPIDVGAGLAMTGTVLSAVALSAGITMSRVVFTSSGTYTKPSNLLYADIEVLGGGGGGGGAGSTGGNGVGAGGGAGGYARKLVDAVSISSTESVTVGAAGTQGAGTAGGTGGAGGTSSFGSIVSATGGNGGNGSTGSGGTFGAQGGVGGVGAGGDTNETGATGLAGIGVSVNFSLPGVGGSSKFGGTGRGRVSGTGGGTAAVANSGSGGTGGLNLTGVAQVGAAGGSGIVIVTEYKSS